MGVCEAWIIAPQGRTVEVLQLSQEHVERLGLYGLGDTVVSRPLPDLRLTVVGIFDVRQPAGHADRDAPIHGWRLRPSPPGTPPPSTTPRPSPRSRPRSATRATTGGRFGGPKERARH